MPSSEYDAKDTAKHFKIYKTFSTAKNYLLISSFIPVWCFYELMHISCPPTPPQNSLPSHFLSS